MHTPKCFETDSKPYEVHTPKDCISQGLPLLLYLKLKRHTRDKIIVLSKDLKITCR